MAKRRHGHRSVREEFFEAAGIETWPNHDPTHALNRFFFRRPGAFYLEARERSETMDRIEPGPTRIRTVIYSIVQNRLGEEKKLKIGSFVHTVTDTGLEKDATMFHDNLYKYLRRNFRMSADKDIVIMLMFYDAEVKNGKYLKSMREPWV